MQRLRKSQKRLIESGFHPDSSCGIEGWGLVAAGVAAAGAIGGAVISGNASQSAAQTQANASQAASNTQLSMFDQTQTNLQPFIASGTNALSTLNSQLGIGANGSFNPNASLVKPFTGADYQKSPGYAFQMSQGVDAVQNSAAAAGGIHGGNTLKALTQFGQGLANTDYQQAYQNYVGQQQQQYGMLNNLVGSGQNAAAGLGGISAGVGGQVGSNIIGGGNALAAGQVGQANAITGGVNSLAQLASLYGNGSYGGTGGGGGANFNGLNPSASGYGTQGGYLLNNVSYCDYAMKDYIEPYQFDGMSGLQVYSFRYKWENEGKRLGYIAQEVAEKYPDAVTRGPRGFLMVDYSKVPSEEDWQELHKLQDGLFQ